MMGFERLKDSNELIIDLDSDSDEEEELVVAGEKVVVSNSREPQALKQWLQSGTLSPRPIAGSKRAWRAMNAAVGPSPQAAGLHEREPLRVSTTGALANSPSRSPTGSQTTTVAHLIQDSAHSSPRSLGSLPTAASLNKEEVKAFADAWTTVTPFFDPRILQDPPLPSVHSTNAETMLELEYYHVLIAIQYTSTEFRRGPTIIQGILIVPSHLPSEDGKQRATRNAEEEECEVWARYRVHNYKGD
ncbi:hypothetical protein CC1G_06835 [Coprinopsis cinerea okayama7|uniref:Uncharacterized protein n=1 Tax=Coprinopsis cinerea (strain Okayama-7 / 130 / ATCC MYA-4618 / FGSC 9003) TaxID=240176 RepID=A8N6W3_COPC7|nr:hypothetical protein CC1G_06835 [Coprinopsis cinerea okayama7\|eukprot:XP_001830569.2 hypothetical protein CC1G_06835 [Coprinopsis cinerea okayama7\